MSVKPYPSSEIRWFSAGKQAMWNIFVQLPEDGEGIAEPVRTDFYLMSGTRHTGIKIRQGNHEIKVKSAPDEQTLYGTIQHWVKWSSIEERNILNTIDVGLLDDWTGIEKRRFLKRYVLRGHLGLVPIGYEEVDEGCGVEFTEIRFPGTGKLLFSLGVEAFSRTERTRENLLSALDSLKPDIHVLRDLDAMSYPDLILRMTRV